MQIWSGVVTDKVQESKNFYVHLFGFEVIYEGDEGWFVLLQLNGCELGFMKPDLETQAEIFRPRFQGRGIWIAVDVDDVEAEYQRIKELGVSIEAGILDEPWGDRHFVIVDPNGIGIDIVQHNHKDQ